MIHFIFVEMSFLLGVLVYRRILVKPSSEHGR